MQFPNHARHASPMIAAESLRLIDLCASIRAENVRARRRAAVAREQLRETLMRYELPRMAAIRGGSGPAVNGESDRRRSLVRTVAAHWPVQLRVGPSAGASCMVCCGAIATGTLQYDIDAGPGRIIVDEHCYMSFLRDVVEGTPAESVDG